MEIKQNISFQGDANSSHSIFSIDQNDEIAKFFGIRDGFCCLGDDFDNLTRFPVVKNPDFSVPLFFDGVKCGQFSVFNNTVYIYLNKFIDKFAKGEYVLSEENINSAYFPKNLTILVMDVATGVLSLDENNYLKMKINLSTSVYIDYLTIRCSYEL
ncbi:MAG: hypothetical protein LBC39_02615 [Methanobrevibacter sp.]|jgi:hypothetical protein|nr:hypothetical protein [Candidatus Methanovirga aequatorialis]